jgi:hypothetical protein
MSFIHQFTGRGLGVLAVTAAAAVPVQAQVASPPEPQPAPGETQIPPAGTAAEDELPLTAAQRSRALAHLRDVARCVRAEGVDIPDPVSDEGGVQLSWDGPPRPAVEAAIGRCDDEISGVSAHAARRGWHARPRRASRP